MRGRTLSEHVFSATAWNTLLLPARLGVGLLASVIYYEWLSRDQVGLVFLLTSLAATLGLYADLGLERSLPRFLPEIEARAGRQGVVALLRRVVGIKLLVLVVVLAGMALLARPLLAELVRRETSSAERLEARAQATEIASPERMTADREAQAKREAAREIKDRGPWLLLAVALLVVLGAGFDVLMQFLTAYFRQRSWNLITLVNALLQPVLVTTFVLAGLGVPGVLLGLVLTPSCALFLAFTRARRLAREIPRAPRTAEAMPADIPPRFTRYAGLMYLHTVTTWLYDLDAVVLLSAAVLGFQDTALLGFAYKLSRDLLAYVWTPLTGVMTPLLVRVKERDGLGALQDAQRSLTRMVWLLLIPALSGLLVLSPMILRVLYPKYAETAPLVALFLGFAFLESMLSVPQNVLMVCDVYRPLVISRLLAVLAIPLIALLLPAFGLVGLAVAVGLPRVLARVYTLAAASRRLGLEPPWAFGGKVVFSAAIMATALLGFVHFLSPGAPPAGGGRLLALFPLLGAIVLGAGVFALVLRALGGVEAVDRERLARLSFPGKAALLRLLSPS